MTNSDKIILSQTGNEMGVGGKELHSTWQTHDQNPCFRLNLQICRLQSLMHSQLGFPSLTPSVQHCVISATWPARAGTVCLPRNEHQECAPRQVFELHSVGVRTPCMREKEGASQGKDTAVALHHYPGTVQHWPCQSLLCICHVTPV